MVRYYLFSELYMSDIECLVVFLLMNIDVCLKYDFEYMDNKLERL